MHLSGGELCSPHWGGYLVQEMGEKLATSGGSSLYQLMSTYQKQNYVAWIALEPWFNACPSDQDFPNRGGVAFPLSGERWEIFLGKNLINMVVWTQREVILTIRTFFKAKNNVL